MGQEGLAAKKNDEKKIYKWWQARRAIYRWGVGEGKARQGRNRDGMASLCPEGDPEEEEEEEMSSNVRT